MLNTLARVTSNKDASEPTRAVTHLKITELKSWLAVTAVKQTTINWKAHYLSALNQQIREYEKDQRNEPGTCISRP